MDKLGVKTEKELLESIGRIQEDSNTLKAMLSKINSSPQSKKSN
jgi:hypothetical protein